MSVPIQNIRRFRLRGRLSHGNTFGSPTTTPATLNRSAQYVLDQGPTNYCTAAARASAGSYFYGRQMSFEYQTAKEGEINGTPIFNGADPNKADEASTTYGLLPSEQSPFTFAKDGWTTPAIWQNWPPALDGQAIINDDFSFYNVYPDYQHIKAALIQGEQDNSVVIANGFWFSNWENPIGGMLPMPVTPITRHDYLFIDFRMFPDGKERLVAQLSQGSTSGFGPELYMDEATVNAAFANPMFNGLGCEIMRKGGVNPQIVLVSKWQLLVATLGAIVNYLQGL